MTAAEQQQAERIIANLSWHFEKVQSERREDLRQEAWAVLARGGYDPSRGPWHTWVWAKARFAMTDYVRRQRLFGPQRGRGVPERNAVEVPLHTLTVDPPAVDPWLIGKVRQLWGALQPRDRQALRERRLPMDRIAARDGISVSAVYWRRREAKRRARELAERMGLKEAA